MENVKLPGFKIYNTQMAIHSETHKDDIILACKCQKHLPMNNLKME